MRKVYNFVVYCLMYVSFLAMVVFFFIYMIEFCRFMVVYDKLDWSPLRYMFVSLFAWALFSFMSSPGKAKTNKEVFNSPKVSANKSRFQQRLDDAMRLQKQRGKENGKA